MILITGASGSIGTALVKAHSDRVMATDVHNLDVTNAGQVRRWVDWHRPSLIYHLAGAKSAPDGELDPWQTVNVNVNGTRNLLDAAKTVGARVITASTCKACDPETVYGATKLIAERMTLKAGGSVARFYNVRESSGNVFRIWEALPEDAPLPVTPCWRYFIGIDDAVRLLLRVADLPSGRYTVNPGVQSDMAEVALEEYPARPRVYLEPRQGDRISEPRHALSERLEPLDDGIERVLSVHEVAK